MRPANTLPSDAASSKEDIVYTPEYLMEHPDELEKLLVELIRRNETDGLKAAVADLCQSTESR